MLFIHRLRRVRVVLLDLPDICTCVQAHGEPLYQRCACTANRQGLLVLRRAVNVYLLSAGRTFACVAHDKYLSWHRSDPRCRKADDGLRPEIGGAPPGGAGR